MLYATVKLYGKNGIHGEFLAYERKALDIFRRYGGEVVIAYATEPAPNKGETDFPDEIQILRIPDRDAFDRFMQDPERLGLAAEREAVIRKTEVYLSAEIIGY